MLRSVKMPIQRSGTQLNGTVGTIKDYSGVIIISDVHAYYVRCDGSMPRLPDHMYSEILSEYKRARLER
jgi:hypothetical protein